jgi:hypothetical protein
MDQHMGNQNPPPNPIGTESNIVDLNAVEDSTPSSFTSKRSLGRDSSKEKAKKQTQEEKKLESMNKHERQKLILERKKLNLEKLKMERQKVKEDTEQEVMILSIDLSKCNPLLRQYYEAKQQEILARVTRTSLPSK